MQIILLHPRFNTRTITLTHWHIMLGLIGFSFIVFLLASSLYYLTFRYGADYKIPFIKDVMANATQDDVSRKDKYVKENLAAMARKLGEMQAQLMRLDALGERVQGLAGVKPQEFNFKEMPGRGGAEPSSVMDQPLSMEEFRKELDAMSLDVDHRADYMNVVESTLMSYKIKSKLLPTIQPVNAAYNSSSFGWRIDPFTGHHTFHEGIDFPAPIGTAINAAAGGVVITAEYHYQFGNMIEIDHGNDIVTRYAHASRLFAKVGDIVKRGQHIADIGTTGRSTGPHLHFEVMVKGIHQDPRKFLAAGASQAQMAALAGK
jgi:murein DD-endopeptidase MepM/ murein hydrolase activator NlpD